MIVPVSSLPVPSSQLQHEEPEKFELKDDRDADVDDPWGPVIKHIQSAFDPFEVVFFGVGIALFFLGLRTYGEPVWAHVIETYSKPTIMLGGTFLITTPAYWFWCGILAVLDILQFPKSFWRYKIQPEKVPTWEWYTRAAGVVLKNQLLVGVPTGLALYKLMEWRGCSYGMDLPSLSQVAKESVGFLFVEEVMFYYGHRALHHPSIYKVIHKKHHLYTAPISISTIYCSPIEHFMSNLAPALLGPVLMKSHVLTLWLWITIAQTNAINSHCGFHVPFFPSPLAHDYHHEVFNKNYGPLGVLDWLHGTAGSRVMTAEKKRLREVARARTSKLPAAAATSNLMMKEE
ncbi:Chromosome 5 4 [Thoreauomyces humboldtii]|nr:Chromosome 5 4 [Thoreauomyces humboldtii]